MRGGDLDADGKDETVVLRGDQYRIYDDAAHNYNLHAHGRRVLPHQHRIPPMRPASWWRTWMAATTPRRCWSPAQRDRSRQRGFRPASRRWATLNLTQRRRGRCDQLDRHSRSPAPGCTSTRQQDTTPSTVRRLGRFRGCWPRLARQVNIVIATSDANVPVPVPRSRSR